MVKVGNAGFTTVTEALAWLRNYDRRDGQCDAQIRLTTYRNKIDDILASVAVQTVTPELDGTAVAMAGE